MAMQHDKQFKLVLWQLEKTVWVELLHWTSDGLLS